MSQGGAIEAAAKKNAYTKKTVDGPVISYPETAVLELQHVAEWLRISERQVERLDIPFALLGKRTKRYLARDVIEYLEKKRVA